MTFDFQSQNFEIAMKLDKSVVNLKDAHGTSYVTLNFDFIQDLWRWPFQVKT